MVQKSRKWATRSEIGKSFTKLASMDTQMIPILPIKQYAKPVSSNQSCFYKNVTQQVSTIPTFSGQTRNDCSDLITYLERGGSELMGSAKGLNSLRSILQGHLEKMRESISKTKIISWGNSEWTTVDRFMQDVLVFPKPDVFEMRMFIGNYESEVS